MGSLAQDSPRCGTLDFEVAKNIFLEIVYSERTADSFSRFEDLVKYHLLHPEHGLRVILLEPSSGLVENSKLFLESDDISIENILFNSLSSTPRQSSSGNQTEFN